MNLTPNPTLLFFAIILSWVIALLTGPALIRFLKKIGAGARVRRDGPQTHLVKDGTPIMGGFIFGLAALATTLVFSSRDTRELTEVLTAMSVAVTCGLIGWLDDASKTVWRNPDGLRAREKMFGQLLITAFLGFMALHVLHLGTGVKIPFTGYEWLMPTWLYYVMLYILVSGTVNAVNFTDGVDGLLATQSLVVFLFYGFVSIITIPKHWNLALFCMAIGGGAVGFLQYNKHPARIFMGDTGSFFLGGALAAMAVLTKTELLLPLAGGMFVIEIVSVILQVASFKLTGKRIFRMSPLHHHFDLLGWPENRIVRTFLAVTLVFLVLAWVGFPS